MTEPAIPDVITIVGTGYYQPIADLIEKLLSKPIPNEGMHGTGLHDYGYSASAILLLAALLESYTARVRFTRRSEGILGDKSTPELLEQYFPDLPTKDELVEVFLIRNVVAHNHVWHLDVSDTESLNALTLSNPKELGFRTNKHYSEVVDLTNRRTNILKLNISPTSINRRDVRKVFQVIWNTLKFMNKVSYGDTPLGAASTGFRGKLIQFGELLNVLNEECVENTL